MNEWLGRIREHWQGGGGFLDFLTILDQMQMEVSGRAANSHFPPRYLRAFLLKISNLLVSKYQFLGRHDFLLSSPLGVYLDPANGCPLRCPGCLHNPGIQKKIDPDWPNGNMAPELFTSFLEQYGPYLGFIFFFNWGEPLLNKNTPLFIRQAKKYLIRTTLSSNLSIPFDAEELVQSGLDFLSVSLDGATSESYIRYRQGGRFDLVLRNLRAVVAAKKKFNSPTPFVSWQYLTFNHNRGEREAALAMAEELEVNTIRFALPYDVSEFDPTIGVDSSARAENPIWHYDLGLERGQRMQQAQELAGNFDSAFASSWRDKAPEKVSFASRKGETCRWLYRLAAVDAQGRVLPCCYAPRRQSEHEYFFSGLMAGQPADHFNSRYYRFARSSFLSRTEEEQAAVKRQFIPAAKLPYCVKCRDDQVNTNITDEILVNYLKQIDLFKILSDESIEFITSWDGLEHG